MYPDSLNMYVYTDQEEHSDASSDVYHSNIKLCYGGGNMDDFSFS